MSDIAGLRADLIAKFRREIQEKTYKVKSGEIAEKIAQKLKENEAFVDSVKNNRWTA
ncbi:MAG: flagellar biosynthesis anti-sigma factor FlgM [Nitrospinae bacterium]|nr:flagellar biosynthesis anti-sigma factor FlgM [Nitrospinota bacterium]